jgi:hypothetical protein
MALAIERSGGPELARQNPHLDRTHDVGWPSSPTRDLRLHHRRFTRQPSDTSKLLPRLQIMGPSGQEAPLRSYQAPFPRRPRIMEDDVPGFVEFPCVPHSHPNHSVFPKHHNRWRLLPGFSSCCGHDFGQSPNIPLPVPQPLAHPQVSQPACQ